MQWSALKRRSGLGQPAGGPSGRAWDRVEALEPRMLLSGELDPTFGAGGVVFSDILGPTSDAAQAVMVQQADGKIIAAGTATSVVGYGAVARYNTDGSPDISFGTDGRAQFPLVGTITSAAIDGAGRIVLGGSLMGDFAAVRLTAAGALDTSFGVDGVAIVEMGSTLDSVFGVTVDAIGQILLGGRTFRSLTRFDFAAARLTPSGELDTAFGSDGRVILDIGGSDDVAQGVALDSQGRIALAGHSLQGLRSFDFAVVRLASTGAIDSRFAGGAAVTVDLGSTHDVAFGVATDSLDRIVLGGRRIRGTAADFAVARLTDGVLDMSFDGDGWAILDLGSTAEEARGVAIDSQDRVVLGGFSLQPSLSGNAFAAARFTPNGALDTTFAGRGWAVVHRSSNDSAFGMAIDSLDRVVLGGRTLGSGANHSDFAVTRLASSGGLDIGFGAGGWVTTDFIGSRSDSGQRVAVAPSGQIVVLGLSQSPSVLTSVTRYNPDGSLDTSFGAGGHVLELPLNESTSLAVDGDGRILVAGALFAGLGRDFAVARFTSSGDLDVSFGTGGVATVRMASLGNDLAFDIAIDSRSRIVLGGRSFQAGTGADFAVARFTSSGAVDTSFNGDGWAVAHFGSSDDAGSIAIDAQDRVVLAGQVVRSGLGQDFAAARFTASGALDTDFGTGGWTAVDLGSTADLAQAVAIDSQGRIVVGGRSFRGTTGVDFAVARLTSSGAVDTSFDGDGWTVFDLGGSFDQVAGVATDPQNRILLGGYSFQGNFVGQTRMDFAAARLTVSGALDATFGDGGVAIHDLGRATDDFASGMAVDARGNILLVGRMARPETNFDIALARILGDPPTAPPSILAVDVGRDFRTVLIDFEGQALDGARASDVANYFILAANGDASGDGDAFNDGDETYLTIDSANYDAATGRVTLTSGAAIFDDQFRIGVDGDDAASDGAAGITDTFGRFLDGGDFTAVIDLQSIGLVGDLITHVEDLGLKTGAETSLVARLEAAAQSLGMTVDSGMGVIAILEAFMKGVQHWYDRGELSQADRDLLIDRAQYIIDGLVALRM